MLQSSLLQAHEHMWYVAVEPTFYQRCTVVFFFCYRKCMILIDFHVINKRVCDLTSCTERRAAWPGGVVPSKAGKRISVEWRVKTIMDAKVLLPHQHLNPGTTKRYTQYQKYSVVFEQMKTFCLPWRSVSYLLVPEPQEFLVHQWVACSGRRYRQHQTCVACQWSASHW